MSTTPTNPVVEMLIDGVWVDITSDCRLESADSGGGIRIKRGRPNQSPIVEPTEFDFTLNNANGVYSPKNPLGPYWGKLGRNQPVRVGLNRVLDTFARTVADSWGSTPSWVDPEGVTQPGYAWTLTGTATAFDVNGAQGTIQAASGYRRATIGTYADVDILTRVKVSDRTSTFGIVLRDNAGRMYTAYITPSTTDKIGVGKVSGATSYGIEGTLSSNVVADTYYWLRAQVAGQRIRVKFWADSATEPTFWPVRYYDRFVPPEEAVPMSGSVGVFAKDGGALVTFDSVQIDHWRAHAEVTQLPPRWDLSRQDRWVPVHATGITRRLGQGRKELSSAVTLHLSKYVGLSTMWFPLERDSGETASNAINGGRPGVISGLTFQTPELTGLAGLPGVAGYAQLSEDTSYFIGSATDYTNTGAWTVLVFFRVPTTPASTILLFTLISTGTARTIKVWLQSDAAVRVDLLASDGSTLSSSSALLFGFTDNPTGCWIAATVYLFDSAGTVHWAFNYHCPTSSVFYTVNGTYSGTVGLFRTITARSSAAHTAAGGLSLCQVLHYAGDLPFVTNDFARAAIAYLNEAAGTRFIRLCNDAGVRVTTMGLSTDTEPMGFQLPAKRLDLLTECAEVEDGIFEESRDDFELSLRTRPSMYNGNILDLDIDAGHLTEPLEPLPDDTLTRNDVTVSRPGGGFAVSIQETGPLNINNPEDDPDGVGVYDEAPELNFAADSQLQPAANWRRSRGTLDRDRYPSVHADLTTAVYQNDAALAAETLSIDSGRMLRITNTEVGPDPSLQLVQSYEETIDQYDLDITWVTEPGDIQQVGVVNYTTRVQPAGSVTAASFVAGTDTALSVERIDSTYGLWVRTADDAAVTGFDIMVAGVRLEVVSISGTTDPQTITVVQTPVNGQVKTIPAGERITLADPWRVAW